MGATKMTQPDARCVSPDYKLVLFICPQYLQARLSAKVQHLRSRQFILLKLVKTKSPQMGTVEEIENKGDGKERPQRRAPPDDRGNLPPYAPPPAPRPIQCQMEEDLVSVNL